jgi:pimeloyl-ACP methyl ester carboxylesterase
MASILFMIHGMWAGPWCFDDCKRFFKARGHRCVATTLPYHDVDPHSPPDPHLGTTSLLDYADALEEEIRALGGRPILVGHSLGGLLAQMLGSRGLAEALVLLAPAAPAGIFAIRPSVARAFWSILTTWASWRKPIRQTFDEAVYSTFHLVPESDRRAIYDRFVAESGRVAYEVGEWVFDTRGASRVDETKVTCPVLIVVGTEDRMTPVGVVRRVARKYAPVATYREFAGHAHWLVGEPGWEEIAEYVDTWLRSLPERRAASVSDAVHNA